MSNDSRDLKTLLAAGGLTAPASTLVGMLSLAPTVSLGISFFVTLAFGFIFFSISVASFFSLKKPKFDGAAWHIGSFSIAGLVFVHWANYESRFLGVISAIIIISVIVLTLVYKPTRKIIRQNYPKYKMLVYMGFLLALVLPLAPLLHNIGQPPKVVITPSTKFNIIYPPGSVETINVSVASTNANAREIALTAESSTRLIAAYLDGKEGGPYEAEFLERNRETSCELKIETSPELEIGEYNITLSVNYMDDLGNAYQDSTLVDVLVKQVSIAHYDSPLIYVIPVLLGVFYYVFIWRRSLD